MKCCIVRRHIMIETQIIKIKNKPVAVVIDFKEYQKLIEASQDRADYNLAVKTKKAVKKWTSHDKLKKDLGL